ncbi:MAG: sensor histidine kinase, partial [Spirochaetaceae bacterium]
APSMAGLVQPIHTLAQAMQRVARGELDVQVPVAGGEEMRQLTDGFNRMTDDLRVHIESRIRYEREAKRMEYDLLAAQINPHFIYNTLNSVIYLARQERSADISTMVASLISILQDTLRISADAILDTLDSELRMAWHYLQIQRYRCGDMYTTKWDVDPDLKQLLVPRSIVQPLVENALFHGILPTGRQCQLSISAKLDGTALRVRVRDDGEGMSPDTLAVVRGRMLSGMHEGASGSGGSMKSIGLRNIYMRLNHIYGDDFSMTVDSHAGSGTVVDLMLPVTGYRVHSDV